MNPPPHEAEASATGHRILLQFPAFGPRGLALKLDSQASAGGQDTYIALHSRSNDIVLYLGIDWHKQEIVLSKRIDGEWLDQFTQNVSLGGDQAQIGLVIRPAAITVEIDGVRQLDWPLEVMFTEVSSLHASGSWVLESSESSGADLPLPDTVLPDLPVENELLATLQEDLIFDFGMHNGDDTDFYLKKGFRVVSVDANPTLCAIAAVRFKDTIGGSRLKVCNIGVAPARGVLSFFINKSISEWSSFDRDIASRGHPVVEVKVRTARPEDFFRAFGVPYYCKIDIEGFDRLVVDGILKLPVKPRYVSFENGELRDFEALVTAGYTAFQLVEQSVVPEVILPLPTAEGANVSHTFASGSSGPFGRDLDGGWIGVEDMRTRLAAHHRDLAARTERGYDWWDLHARYQNA
ncbi:MAG: FkbM family methyltransferase [Akkermansiaceae bacterium]